MKEIFVKFKNLNTGKVHTMINLVDPKKIKKWKVGQVSGGCELLDFYFTDYRVKPSDFFKEPINK